jgi:hypothetical protein
MIPTPAPMYQKDRMTAPSQSMTETTRTIAMRSSFIARTRAC